MDKKTLKKASFVEGSISLPGSKSITNRLLLIAALSRGTTLVKDYLDSDDTQQMLNALKLLGVSYQKIDKDIKVIGISHKFPKKNVDLFLGNAGTAFRPLVAVLAILGGSYELKGIPRMHERPIKDLVDALLSIGADIKYLDQVGYPPLKISESKISINNERNPNGTIYINGDISSQYATALLIAAPLANENLTIQVDHGLVSEPYIDITLKLLEKFGIYYDKYVKHINRGDDHSRIFELKTPAVFTSPKEIFVEGDASSASYFFAAGAISGSIEVMGINKSSIQGDLKFLDVLSLMGANVEYLEKSIKVSSDQTLKGMTIDCKEIPDAAMTLAILAMFSSGTTTLTNIKSWRVKETDRIKAMENELSKLGASVSSTDSSITIKPPKEIINGVEIDTYNDHRIAMCFSLISLAYKEITILDPKCVNKTYPEFFKDFEAVTS